MQRIKVYRTFKTLAITILVIGTLTVLMGLTMLAMHLIDGADFRSFDEGLNSIVYIVQGACLSVLSGINLFNRRYYIEWDDDEINMLLPDKKITEKIKFDQVRSVNIRLFEIELQLENGKRVINLDNVESDDLKKIKQKFENIRERTLA